jgi:carbon-monoxide dehydrogenase small subunit
MPNISLSVNDKPFSLNIEARLLLVELIREKLGLTGTHIGCDTSQCGACVVHVDGAPVKSCTMLAVQADGTELITIEGLVKEDKLTFLQQAFHEHHGLQCGFCTPGMIMTASALLKNNPEPTEEEVRHELEGNICRCTGYQNIIKAILYAAKVMRD